MAFVLSDVRQLETFDPNSLYGDRVIKSMFRETVPYTPPGGLPKQYEFVRLGYLGVGPAATPTSEYLVNYDYDGNSDRLKQVTGTGLPSGGANCSYLAGSLLLEKIEFKQGSAVKAAVTRSYEPDRDLLAAVENKWGSDV